MVLLYCSDRATCSFFIFFLWQIMTTTLTGEEEEDTEKKDRELDMDVHYEATRRRVCPTIF